MLFIPHFENCHAAATSFKMTVKVAWHTASERQWFSTENILSLGGHVAMPGDGTGCHTARTGQREMPLNIPQAQDSPPQQRVSRSQPCSEGSKASRHCYSTAAQLRMMEALSWSASSLCLWTVFATLRSSWCIITRGLSTEVQPSG